MFTTDVAEKIAGSKPFSSIGEQVFLGFAILVGLVAAPVQAASRSLLARLAPAEKITQYFGLFAFSGKVTAFLAPFASPSDAGNRQPAYRHVGPAGVPIRRRRDDAVWETARDRTSRDPLMPEVAHAGEDHGEAALVGGGDHLVVAHRAARLDDRRGAGLGRREQPVGEGEERVRGDDRAARQRLGEPSPPLRPRPLSSAAMRAESTRLIWPAPMPTVAPSLA